MCYLGYIKWSGEIKQEMSQIAHFCCRYPLEFRRQFWKLMYWNSPWVAQTRYTRVNEITDPRNIFLLLYYTSPCGYLPWQFSCLCCLMSEKKHCCSCQPQAFWTDPVWRRCWSPRGAPPLWFCASYPRQKQPGSSALQKHKAYCLQEWLAELENHNICLSTVPGSNDTPQLATQSC